jgi:solute carrier family 13 (sodium-dependent dicarboxylate transporter), member 2/3/5
MISKKNIGLLLGPLVFFIVKIIYNPNDLSEEGLAILASTLWVAIWWVTEAVPIYVTALIPIILFPLSGGLELKQTTSAYGHKFVFLFVGGFILAIAIEKWRLHKRIALNIINVVGTKKSNIILGFMLATAFLSMWISNTATAVMIMPVGLAIISQLKDNPNTLENENTIFGKTLMLCIAYSASIGGMATLIGTPPNLVLAGVIKTSYDIEINFLQWMSFGFPISLLLLFICWKYLTAIAYKFNDENFESGLEEISDQIKGLGKFSYEEKSVLIVFITTALAWITQSFIIKKYVPEIDDTIIAIIAAVVLFILPDKSGDNKLLNWSDAVKLPWGILLLFGGGMALAKGFDSSGLAVWIGNQMNFFSDIPLIILLLFLIAMVNFLTEITSNLATTAMLLPVLVALANTIDINPYYLLVGATVAASCAFMLPVATPPNAVVFGSKILHIDDMIKKGFWMNLISIIILTVAVYWILPLIWGF